MNRTDTEQLIEAYDKVSLRARPTRQEVADYFHQQSGVDASLIKYDLDQITSQTRYNNATGFTTSEYEISDNSHLITQLRLDIDNATPSKKARAEKMLAYISDPANKKALKKYNKMKNEYFYEKEWKRQQRSDY